jgi:hypothetical protein
MFENVFGTYRRLLDGVTLDTHRYLFQQFKLKNRLTGLIGPRGTGKTTLLLQYIKERIEDKDKCLYVSLDSIYLSATSLVSLVGDLYELYGIRYLILDEVHKYPNWNQELKNIYDSYPDMQVIFSGSSSIDLIKGSYDLSRRSVLYRLRGLSFREYLDFIRKAEIGSVSLDSLLTDRDRIESEVAGIEGLRGHFKRYLSHGYYPFFLEDESSYFQKLFRIIEKTIYEDIPHYYKLKTENLIYFKRILAYVATKAPGELNRNNIARNIGLDNKTVQHYLTILEETGLIAILGGSKGGGGQLKAIEKIYLENPNLYNSICEEIGHSLDTGSIRETFFLGMLRNAGFKPVYSTIGDFQVADTIFEIGGRNKSLKQIRERLDPAFLVKDDILYGSPSEIPLHLFGFLY